MKKIIIVFLSIFIFCGCNNLMNTPIKKVEYFFDKYQTLDDSLLNDLSYSIESQMLTEEEKRIYKNVMKRQYFDLIYTIKDYEIDGNKAIVKAEIEVYDYSIAIKNALEYANLHKEEFLNENNEIDKTKYLDYKLSLMKNIDERTKYTLELSLTKKNKTWILDKLSDENIEKIHGVYIN